MVNSESFQENICLPSITEMCMVYYFGFGSESPTFPFSEYLDIGKYHKYGTSYGFDRKINGKLV